MTRALDISEVCYVISVAALLGILMFVVMEGPPININPMELKPQIIVTIIASLLSMGVALVAIYFKDYIDNRPPLEFKFDLKQSNEDKKVRFLFYFKNNIDSVIIIESYHILITKTEIGKPVLDPRPHFYGELIYPKKDWQELPFDSVSPKEYNIQEGGRYGIIITIMYKYKNKQGKLVYALIKDINVPKQPSENPV